MIPTYNDESILPRIKNKFIFKAEKDKINVISGSVFGQVLKMENVRSFVDKIIEINDCKVYYISSDFIIKQLKVVYLKK